MAQDQDFGNLIWFVAGAAAGAALALLFAPASGTKTRQYISETTQKTGQALAESSKEMYDRGRDLYERGRKMADEAAELLERGRNIVEKAAEAATTEAQS